MSLEENRRCVDVSPVILLSVPGLAERSGRSGRSGEGAWRKDLWGHSGGTASIFLVGPFFHWVGKLLGPLRSAGECESGDRPPNGFGM